MLIYLLCKEVQGNRNQQQFLTGFGSSRFAKISSFYPKNKKIDVSSTIFHKIEAPIRLSFEKEVSEKRSFSSDYKITNTRFEFCETTKENGGAIFSTNAAGTLIDIYFYRVGAINGGAVYVTGGSITMQQCNAVKCSSKLDGSAYFFRGASVDLRRGSIMQCHAGRDGALVTSICTFNMNTMKIYDNKASNNYGAVCLNETQGVSLQLYFHGNDAKGEIGKSMCIWSSEEYILENAYFYDNIDKQLASSDDSNVRFNNLAFVALKPQDYLIENNGGGEKVFVYRKSELPSMPEVDPELLQEIFDWKVVEKDFKWNELYIIASLLAIAFAIVWLLVPKLISPPTKEIQWQSI